MTGKILLVTMTIISFLYFPRFGYIWSGYGHGGQILGLPFALAMLFITVKYFNQSKVQRKSLTILLGVAFFLTLAGFSITIEIFRILRHDYFKLLYSEPNGFVNKIFLIWLIVGLTISAVFRILKIGA